MSYTKEGHDERDRCSISAMFGISTHASTKHCANKNSSSFCAGDRTDHPGDGTLGTKPRYHPYRALDSLVQSSSINPLR